MAEHKSSTPSEIFHPLKCAERGCVFPPDPGEILCPQHLRMFAFEESLYESSLEATEEDVASAIFYDESVSVKKRGVVPLDEWFENREWKKTLAMAGSWRSREWRRRWAASGICTTCGSLRTSGSVTCKVCKKKRREYERKRHLAGQCTACGVKVENGERQCRECNLKHYAENKRFRIRRVAQGNCIRCLSRPCVPGMSQCESCNRESIERWRLTRELRDAAGRCVSCGGIRDQENKYCSNCVYKKLECARRLRALRDRAGKCTDCGRDRDRNLKLCSNCANKRAPADQKRMQRSSPTIRRTITAAEQRSALRRRRRDAGLCVCGRVRDVAGRKECASCLARHRDRVRRLAAAGICRSCAKAEAVAGHSLCAPCRLNRKTWLAARTSSRCQRRRNRRKQ